MLESYAFAAAERRLLGNDGKNLIYAGGGNDFLVGGPELDCLIAKEGRAICMVVLATISWTVMMTMMYFAVALVTIGLLVAWAKGYSAAKPIATGASSDRRHRDRSRLRS